MASKTWTSILFLYFITAWSWNIKQSAAQEKLQDVSYFNEIFVGRCLEYQEHLFPELFVSKKIDCQQALKLFRDAAVSVIRQASHNCTANPDSYGQVLHALDHPFPTKAKFLLYTKLPYDFIRAISDTGRRYYFIGNSLMGYTVNGLRWCNTKEFPFEESRQCNCYSSNIEYSYWIQASKTFAQKLRGRIHIALNGSNPTNVAYAPNGILRNFEIPIVLNKSRDDISGFTVMVAQSLHENDQRENCASQSVRELQAAVVQSGFHYECKNNPDVMRHEKCQDSPKLIDNCRFLYSSGSMHRAVFLLVLFGALVAIFSNLLI